MVFKLSKKSQKHGGTVMLNSILILVVSIMVIGYSNAYLSEQINDYRQLDNLYKQQIKKKINKSNKINYCESRNP